MADGYSIFLSPHNGHPLCLGRRSGHAFSKFLPLTSDRKYQEQPGTLSWGQHGSDLNSDDPLGMAQSHSHSVVSPSLDMRR